MRSIIALILPLFALSATADPCLDLDDHLKPAWYVDLGHTVRDAVVQGQYAYAITADDGSNHGSFFRVFDLSSGKAEPVGGYAFSINGWNPYRLVLHGEKAYAVITDRVRRFHGLIVIDISTPSSPDLTSAMQFSDRATDVVLDGDLLYITTGDTGLKVVDLSSYAPWVVDDYELPGHSHAVAVSGERLYVGTTTVNPRLRIYEKGGGDGLVHLGDAAVSEGIHGLAADGDHVFTIGPDGGMRVADVSDPAHVSFVAAAPMQEVCTRIVLNGTTALLRMERGGLAMVDVSDPVHPGDVRYQGINVFESAEEFAALFGSDDWVVASSGNGLFGLTSPPQLPAPILGSVGDFGCHGITCLGNRAYVTDDRNLYAIDVTNPGAPSVVNETVLYSGYRYGIGKRLVAGAGRLYTSVLLGSYGSIPESKLVIVDPISLEITKWISLETVWPYRIKSLALDGDRLYLNHLRLRIFDLGDPDHPVEIGKHDELVGEIAPRGDLLYAGRENAISVFNVRNPENINELDRYDTGSETQGLNHAGNHLYAVLSSGFLITFDLSRPRELNPIAFLDMGSLLGDLDVRDMKLIDDRLYLATDIGALIVNVAEPSDPYHEGAIANPGGCTGVAPLPSNLLVLGSQGDYFHGLGVSIAERPCAMTPVLLGSFDALTVAGGVNLRWLLGAQAEVEFHLEAELNGETWAVSHDPEGFGIFSARDRHPQLRQGGLVNYRLQAREPGKDWQLLRSESLELSALADTPRLLGAWPNPFNPHCSIRFSVPELMRVRVDIHDLNGRRVITLVDETFGAGVHELVWDGRDQAGVESASGVYFMTWRSRGTSSTERLVLLR